MENVMKHLLSITAWCVLSMIGGLSMMNTASAWVGGQGVEPPSADKAYPTDYFNPQTGEIRNPVVLNQRLQERRLDTSVGIVDVPYSAQIIDSRPVDAWYDRKAAKATLIFKRDKMIRVEITE